jgi:hypothetical protein
MIGLARRQEIDVACSIDIEHTADRLHAHVDLHTISIGPGDEVLVHDAPGAVDFGGRLACQRRATVVRATWLGRLHAKLAAYANLTEMFEVGYPDGRGK